MKVHSLRDI